MLYRLYWDNGGVVMLTSALIMSCGALAVALIDDRVPVFEIVVRHPLPLFWGDEQCILCAHNSMCPGGQRYSTSSNWRKVL